MGWGENEDETRSLAKFAFASSLRHCSCDNGSGLIEEGFSKSFRDDYASEQAPTGTQEANDRGENRRYDSSTKIF
jgi:hypothetical protein